LFAQTEKKIWSLAPAPTAVATNGVSAASAWPITAREAKSPVVFSPRKERPLGIAPSKNFAKTEVLAKSSQSEKKPEIHPPSRPTDLKGEKMTPKPWINNLRIYEPGKPIEEVARELGFEHPEQILKLASNENELGPSPLALDAMQDAAAEMHRYPDGSAFYLRQKLAEHLQVAPENLLFGNGSNELIVFLCHAFLETGTNLVMGAEAFAVYFLAAALYQAEVIRVPMPNHTHDLDALLKAIRPETRLVVVVNPNNPTGTSVSPEALDRFIQELPEHVLAIFDEAYFELMPENLKPDLLKYIRAGKKNILLLRTFSKAYGLAGLRIGYAVAHPDLINLLHRVRQPFNVNSMAQAAAYAALEDKKHLNATRKTIFDGLAFFQKELSAIGIKTAPSATNFIMAQTGRAREIFHALQLQKVIVRPLDPYGLPEHIRITIGTAEQNQKVLHALQKVLPSSSL
jgi:histidinol-phosphate aminotransferase